MFKDKKKILEKLRTIKKTAEKDIKKNHPGYENCVIKDVIHYNKKVELVNRESGEKDKFDLCVALAEDPDTGEIWEMYYLNGKEVDFTELMRKYESATPIKDVMDATRENEEKPVEEQNEDYKKDEMNELELKNEEKENENEVEGEENNSIVGQKPKNVIQTIDPHKTYVNGLQTVSNTFNISSDVSQIAIAYTEKGDENALSKDITIYMLDKDGRIIEESNNKKITELFEIDNATGINSISDQSTRMKLDNTVEQDANRTMARFKSKEGDFTISVDQKKVLGHHQVYAGSKTLHGNSDVEVELDRDDTGKIQTNLNVQRVVDYGDGIYKRKEVDEEAREHVEHGDDKEKIAIENADGEKNTVVICDSPYIPGTEMTWEELSEETGEGITRLQERFEKELESGKEPEEIVDEIEYDYGMIEHTRDRR